VPGNPAWGGDHAAVLGHGLGVVPVKIGDVNLAGAPVLGFEGDFGLGDPLAAERLDEIIREGVSLAPNRCAGISLRDQRALVDGVRNPPLQVPVVTAADQELGAFGVSKRKALDVEVESA